MKIFRGIRREYPEFCPEKTEIVEAVKRRRLFGKQGEFFLHFKKRKRKPLHSAVERVKMKSYDSAARAEVRDRIPRFRAGETGQKHRIGREAIQPRILYDF